MDIGNTENSEKQEEEKAIKKPRVDISKQGLNNFTQKGIFKIPVVRHTKHNEFTVTFNEFGKEVREKVVYDMEYTPVIKVFTSNDNRKIIASLPAPAKELLLWLFYVVPSNDDCFWLNRERYMKENKIKSNSTFLSAVRALMKFNIINPTGQEKDAYWLNPKHFFRGNRIEIFENNVEVVYNYSDKKDQGKEVPEEKIDI